MSTYAEVPWSLQLCGMLSVAAVSGHTVFLAYLGQPDKTWLVFRNDEYKADLDQSAQFQEKACLHPSSMIVWI